MDLAAEKTSPTAKIPFTCDKQKKTINQLMIKFFKVNYNILIVYG